MRQFRTSGSVEGVTGNRHLYSDLDLGGRSAPVGCVRAYRAPAPGASLPEFCPRGQNRT